MNSWTLADVQWLTSSAAEPWLQTAAEFPAPARPRDVAQLRRDLAPEQTHLVLETARLRRIAQAKFPQAAEMFFTQQTYEQATDAMVARWKAQRFALDRPTADLCCSIGGDLLAMAHVAPTATVHAVDLNPVTLHLAAANAAAHGLTSRCKLLEMDAAQFPVEETWAWHADPDRRSRSRRTSQVQFGSPSLEVLESLLARNGNAALKLAPAADIPDSWQSAAECEWISRQGECRQLVAWFGELARQPATRTATALSTAGLLQGSTSGTGEEELPLAARLGRYLYEPDAAVLAAQLTGALAQQHGLVALARDVAYLTGDVALNDGLLAGFEILDVLPLRPKSIIAWLREHGMGRVEVKRRGVDVDPLPLQRRWSGSGDPAAVVLLTRLGNARKAIIARRLDPDGGVAASSVP